MTYSTQMEAARKGIVTDKMKDVLKTEPLTESELLELMAKGEVIIPANKNHKNLIGRAVGRGTKTKMNVNLGVSEDVFNPKDELAKVDLALKYDADAIMDLSTHGNTQLFRQKVLARSTVMVGTVPIYDTLNIFKGDIKAITAEDFFKVAERHMEDGVDFLTIHAGLNRACIPRIKNNERLTKLVSRGGSILYEWMIRTNNENPFYEHFDRLLELCYQYDVTLSLGDGLRPGCLKDATDAPQIQELIILGELTKRAWERNVQVMIEGPGHVPLNEIEANILLQKKLCHKAPFYVLGPLVTDIAPGYDHITSAIGGALAAAKGADFLCYVTPAEHLKLPDLDDVKEGIIASKIAAHAADIAKNLKGAIEWDHKMSKARHDLDWETQIESAIDPEKAQKYRDATKVINGETCTMCGDFCPIKRTGDIV